MGMWDFLALLRVHRHRKSKRMVRRVALYQAAKAGVYRSPRRLLPRPVRKAYFVTRTLRRQPGARRRH